MQRAVASESFDELGTLADEERTWLTTYKPPVCLETTVGYWSQWISTYRTMARTNKENLGAFMAAVSASEEHFDAFQEAYRSAQEECRRPGA